MANTRNQLCPCGSGLKYKKCCGKVRQEAGKHAGAALTSIRVVDDIAVVVPDSLDLISPYVLREQENWFEAEIPFLRRFVQPGMSVIDIGANFGIYTLLLARWIGNKGRLWAFEPASVTAACLTKSVGQNNLSNVKVVQAALSNRGGTAILSLNDNSELNSLTSDASVRSEKVPITTLDECAKEMGWSAIDLVKLDAEGEEGNILRGGERFFADQSPLVMFEIKHGETWNSELISQFAGLGYASYRLVPGLDLLVPEDLARPPDPMQLNLFCCKRERAMTLRDAGLLIMATTPAVSPAPLNNPQWQQQLLELPFAKKLWGAGTQRDFPLAHDYSRALELYMLAQSPQSAPQRYGALRQAASLLESIAGEGTRELARLSTLARILGDLGQRQQEVQTLDKLLARLPASGEDLVFDEVFLPACRRFEQIDTWKHVIDWFAASVLEELELKCAYSSYYSGKASLQRLETLRSLGFQSAEMERRRQLVRMRSGVQPGPVFSPLLAARNEQNRNPDYWRG